MRRLALRRLLMQITCHPDPSQGVQIFGNRWVQNQGCRQDGPIRPGCSAVTFGMSDW